MTYSMVAMSGSLRADSSNTGLVRMAMRLAPDRLAITLFEGPGKLPFYNADLDTPDTLPSVVAEFRQLVADAHAVLLAAPEYNYGASGAMKNAFDWLSRPMGANAFRGKVVSIVTSGGKGGGRKVQAYFNEILGLFGNQIVAEPEIAIAMGPTLIAADGTTTDPAIEAMMADRLTNVLTALDARSSA